MEIKSKLDTLFQHACKHQFDDFDRLFKELEAKDPAEDIWEAYLMRAQIKLYASDPSLLSDVEIAYHRGSNPRYPLLSTIWGLDAPNRLIVFPKESGSLCRFFQSLATVREILAAWYGNQGHITVSQLQSEICFFLGDFQRALDFLMEYPLEKRQTNIDGMLSLMMQFRCYFALGRPQKAEQCMLEMIRLAQSCPECIASYQCLRGWVIVMTSWNGDSPRYYTNELGEKLPVLEDRLEDVRNGSSIARPLEVPFVEYAERHYKNACQIRQVYMDAFYALYWHTMHDRKKMDASFLKLYELDRDCGIITPLIECGGQMISLLQCELGNNLGVPESWIRDKISRAEQYEVSIYKYQAILE